MMNQTGVPEIQKAVVILHKMSLYEEVQEMAGLRRVKSGFWTRIRRWEMQKGQV